MFPSDLDVMHDLGFPFTSGRIREELASTRDELIKKRSVNTLTFYVANIGELNDWSSFHDTLEDAKTAGKNYIDKVENGKVVFTWENTPNGYVEFA